MGASIVHLILKSTGAISGTILGINVASPVNLGAFTMLLGLILVPLVSLATPKMNKADVDKIFACYDEKVTVASTIALDSDDDEA